MRDYGVGDIVVCVETDPGCTLAVGTYYEITDMGKGIGPCELHGSSCEGVWVDVKGGVIDEETGYCSFQFRKPRSESITRLIAEHTRKPVKERV